LALQAPFVRRFHSRKNTLVAPDGHCKKMGVPMGKTLAFLVVLWTYSYLRYGERNFFIALSNRLYSIVDYVTTVLAAIPAIIKLCLWFVTIAVLVEDVRYTRELTSQLSVDVRY